MTDIQSDNPRIAKLEEQLENVQAAHLRELAISKERTNLFEAMTETVPVGVVVADEKGRIMHGNSQVEKMLRHPVLNSKNVDDYDVWVSFHPDGRRVESHEYPLSRVIKDGEEHSELDVHYQRGDGTRFWLRIIGEPVFNAANERIGAVVALVDIDEEVRLRQTQEVLIGELNHRVKNAFTVSQAIVGRILRTSNSDEDLISAIDTRLKAYAEAHSKLVGSDWANVPISEVAKDVLGHIDDGRIGWSGPQLVMPSRTALALSMALYELASNAVKYGSLSVASGRVDFTWSVDAAENGGENWLFSWRETGGPRPIATSKQGFGSFITGRAIMTQTKGKTEAQFAEEGLRWTLKMPSPAGIEDTNG